MSLTPPLAWDVTLTSCSKAEEVSTTFASSISSDNAIFVSLTSPCNVSLASAAEIAPILIIITRDIISNIPIVFFFIFKIPHILIKYINRTNVLLSKCLLKSTYPLLYYYLYFNLIYMNYYQLHLQSKKFFIIPFTLLTQYL